MADKLVPRKGLRRLRDAKMILRIYSKLSLRGEHLKAAVTKVRPEEG